MSVNLNELEKIAHLAKLKLTDDEKDKFLVQINQILSYVEKLNQLDTKNVIPLSHSMDLVNVMRDDQVKDSLPTEKALQNAPSKTKEFFSVPKVISK